MKYYTFTYVVTALHKMQPIYVAHIHTVFTYGHPQMFFFLLLFRGKKCAIFPWNLMSLNGLMCHMELKALKSW